MRILSLALTLLGLLCGCEERAPAARLLKVNFASEPSTLDPRKGGDVTSSTLQFMLYEGLVRYAKDPMQRLGMAKEIEVSEDGLTYTFYLREAKWSDGHPVTAFDFEYTYRSMLEPSFPCPNANLLYPIKYAREIKEGKIQAECLGVTAKDSTTLVMCLNHPTPYFLDLLSFCVFCPVPSHLPIDEHHLVTNGPFILDKWHHHASLLLKKNPYYWQQEAIHIDQILATLISDSTTTFEMFQKQQLDILGVPFSPLPTEAAKELIKDHLLNTHPSAATSFLSFNIATPPFHHPLIRKAFALCIDRALLTQNVTQLGERVATGIIPPNLKSPSQTTFTFPFDPDLGRDLLQQGLDELGLTREELPKISYLFNLNEANTKVAQAIQDAFRTHLGIEVDLRGAEHKVYLDKLASRDFHISQSYLLAQFSDQMNILDRFKYRDNPKNHPGWYHPAYEELLDRSLYLQGEARAEILSAAETLLIEEGALSPLYHWSSCSMSHPHVRGFNLSEVSSIDWTEVHLEE